jgi:Amidohydrolase
VNPQRCLVGSVNWPIGNQAAGLTKIIGGHSVSGSPKGVVVGLHNTVNMRYPVDLGELDGSRETGGYFERSWGASAPFRALATPRSQASDLIASMIGHGMLSRFPRLKVVVVEHYNEWTRPMLNHFAETYERAPTLFEEDPPQVLRRNVWIHIFRDSNPVELIGMLGVANSMFGSDFPHPEGLRDPLAFSDDIASLPLEDQRAVMGGQPGPSHGRGIAKTKGGTSLWLTGGTRRVGLTFLPGRRRVPQDFRGNPLMIHWGIRP